MLGGGPAAHVGADLGDQLQRRVGAEGIELAQVGAAGESMQRGADVEARLVAFGRGGAPRRRQLAGGRRLPGGKGVEQRLDGSVALSDLLEVELVSREILPEREQVLGAVVAGERGNIFLGEAWQR